ncbi:MAG: hypothetical protein ACOY4I_05580 [Bacillota bacterium]
MKSPLGNFIVLFKPGVVTGIHSGREVILSNICDRFGGFDCKIFDPYTVYAGLVDADILVKVEQRNIYGYSAVSFFYPDRHSEHRLRQKILNKMLAEIKSDPRLIRNGYAVVTDKGGDLRLFSLNILKQKECY